MQNLMEWHMHIKGLITVKQIVHSGVIKHFPTDHIGVAKGGMVRHLPDRHTSLPHHQDILSINDIPYFF